MADDSLPTEYDAIVVGTGMTECIIAAALSRIGQKVLHLDRNDYYSGDWGTFHFEALQKWIAKQQGTDTDKLNIKAPKEDLLKEGEESIPFKIESTAVSNVKERVFIPEELPPKDVPAVDVKEEGKQEPVVGETSEDKEKGSESDKSGEKDQVAEGSEPKDESAGPSDKSEKTEDAAAKKEEEKEPEQKEWCFSEIKKQWRKFNIDLQPKMLYCRGPMVQLLISSDIAKYCEFKSITRILTLLDDKLQQVPCSRADVFSSKQVSMIEKRMLMKLLTFCMEYDKHPEEYEGFEDKTFDEFLGTRKLTPNVRHYVKYAIAMATDTTNTLEGLKSTQKFLQSLGRYGNTAFLWPLYGSGEMPQCFCRMCAVFGGIYCLRRTGVSLIVDKEKKCQGIVDSEGIRLDTKWIVVESSYTSGELAPKSKPSSISRGVFVIDRSLHSTGSDHISLLNLPPCEGQGTTVSVIELSPASMACPKDTYLVHMTCTGSKGPEEDLAVPMKKLFQPEDHASQAGDDARPIVMWSLFFSQEDTTPLPLNDHGLGGVFVVGTPDGQLDFDHSIQEARGIFEKICPGEEFLPRAPNPEDIIYDDDHQGPNAEGSGFEPNKEGEEGQEKKEGGEEKQEGQEKKEEGEKKQEGQEKSTADEENTKPKADSVSDDQKDPKETSAKGESSSIAES